MKKGSKVYLFNSQKYINAVTLISTHYYFILTISVNTDEKNVLFAKLFRESIAFIWLHCFII